MDRAALIGELDDVDPAELLVGPEGGWRRCHGGHADVHQHHVGSEVLGQADAFVAVGRFRDDLDVGLTIEDHAEPCPQKGLIVDDEDAIRHG
jgi:hypothetical protein